MRKLFCKLTGGHSMKLVIAVRVGGVVNTIKRCWKCEHAGVGVRHESIADEYLRCTKTGVDEATLARLKAMAEPERCANADTHVIAINGCVPDIRDVAQKIGTELKKLSDDERGG